MEDICHAGPEVPPTPSEVLSQDLVCVAATIVALRDMCVMWPCMVRPKFLQDLVSVSGAELRPRAVCQTASLSALCLNRRVIVAPDFEAFAVRLLSRWSCTHATDMFAASCAVGFHGSS